MSSQLDILALEPFYGGVRRLMLETLIHHSRHRWTVLKLPPRRIERRLTLAAHWFAEQLSRHWVGKVDLLFTSEALNLADFHRLMPNLARQPSVVYFHANQLPPLNQTTDSSALDLVNLSSAQAASDLWFNSMYHLEDFFQKAGAMVQRNHELSGRSPLEDMSSRSRVILPPIDTQTISDDSAWADVKRLKRLVFVDTRDADQKLINAMFRVLQRRAEKWEFVTVGPVDALDPDFPRRTLSERDDIGQLRAMREASVFISTKGGAFVDHYAVWALAADCWPIFPNTGVYPELLPPMMHQQCLHDGTSSRIASMLQNVWHIERPAGYQEDVADLLKKFDPATVCRQMDTRLEELASQSGNRR